MAIQVINDPTYGRLPQDNSILGALGTGIGQGLQAVAQSKLAQLQQRHATSDISSRLQGLGIPQAESEYLAALPPKEQVILLQDYLLGQQGAAPQLGGIQSPSEQGSMTMAAPAPASQAGPAESGAPSPLSFTEALTRARSLKNQQKEADSLRKEIAERFKITKDDRKEILEKTRAARSNLHDLQRLSDLENEGKLDTAGYSEFLKRSGLDIPALMNEGSQEFQKIATNFLRDAKTYFGGRVSNYEAEQFLKTIPSLSQSPEGRKRVIANLRYINNMALEYNKALKEIVSEHKGIPPYDLLEQIDDRVEKKQESLSQKFKDDLSKPVPRAQNRIITALQAVGGSLLGAPGSLLGKVGGAGHSVGASDVAGLL